MPISLATAIKSLRLNDQFAVYPTCPTCHRIETATIPTAELEAFTCPACDTELFSSSSAYHYFSTLLDPVDAPASWSRPQPKMVVSYRSIPALLSEFLSRDGMVENMDTWRVKDRVQDRLRDVMDGRIWKELQGPDGKPFFGDHCPDELRVGLVIHLDWCNFRCSAQSTHHSTGLFSISVANLPESERYQTKNLLIPCIMPGPTEPNTRQLQEYIILMVDELLQLYDRGMDCPASPNRLVRAAVTLVICDHPAMCKFFGLADKRHENSPCHRCDVKASEWSTEKSLSCGCRSKTFEELRELALAYQQLPLEEQDGAFKQSGVRWFAFLKLPYFNPRRMAVLDPMHNILLGRVSFNLPMSSHST
ncbi:hypothetical protein M407DRAFT_32505 [Tulasnella calospora MUT 4182]|uniref:Uncharacterized protein n=1 Tax=Tulasnella calospora MUT 4182 TaxID=1051891 RepID=A0A0C3K8P7_9AGAM|nr:hypothetical protein M407DRAFT_32505 [Tulasnella calospora MUT 4182]